MAGADALKLQGKDFLHSSQAPLPNAVQSLPFNL